MLENDDLFTQMSDNEIIAVIKNGDNTPFDVIFKRYHALSIKITKDFYLKSFESDDFLQEARMVFNKTIHTFDSEKGHTFGNFYKLNLKHHIYSLVRKDMAKKRIIEKNAESLEEMLESQQGMQYILQGKGQLPTIEILQVRERLADYQDTLSEFEQRVFLDFIHNKDVEAISVHLNCDTLRVKNALDRCKRKLKQLLE
ncbi:sigma-70 family RNA polymerase sigma factor [Carnobacterium sp. TMP28]|uniref:sigma-70 family RNA polymerase sigma factor n=1 Tax=Carnobacterium sp. TMP28 TaxID=3397060 RepID=UPI0039E07A63